MNKFEKLQQVIVKFVEDLEELGYVVYQEEDKDNLIIDIEEKK
ncbi:hypothetical protein PN398_07915 [Romboutsia sp. 1001216sp1]|nr:MULTISPECIES: hypothetical protein [unclassified Romboutsia]MDB8790644.1 hypothetical protein [Romboutsia sp. 1001216sp1]MDB8803263.1 hypothetical protein [Romboutsia sp. 1001216sp1]MDB8814629.1 hypothetical protein [Romboutsia sp. 1001216sp1]